MTEDTWLYGAPSLYNSIKLLTPLHSTYSHHACRNNANVHTFTSADFSAIETNVHWTHSLWGGYNLKPFLPQIQQLPLVSYMYTSLQSNATNEHLPDRNAIFSRKRDCILTAWMLSGRMFPEIFTKHVSAPSELAKSQINSTNQIR